MDSPFNEMTTFLLSPVLADKFAIFLYRAGMGDQSFVADYGETHNVIVNPMLGMITIYTSTVEFYEAARDYLTDLYKEQGQDEGECIGWE